MRRVMDGDDEALDGLIRELRPVALQLIPDPARQRVAADILASEACIALYEALMLWNPTSGRQFVEVLGGRVHSRIRALFQRLDALERAVMEVN